MQAHAQAIHIFPLHHNACILQILHLTLCQIRCLIHESNNCKPLHELVWTSTLTILLNHKPQILSGLQADLVLDGPQPGNLAPVFHGQGGRPVHHPLRALPPQALALLHARILCALFLLTAVPGYERPVITSTAANASAATRW